MKAILYALKDFLCLALWLLACGSVSVFLGWFGPWMDEYDRKKAASQELAKIVAQCGEGAALKRNANGVVTGCKARWGKS